MRILCDTLYLEPRSTSRLSSIFRLADIRQQVLNINRHFFVFSLSVVIVLGHIRIYSSISTYTSRDAIPSFASSPSFAPIGSVDLTFIMAPGTTRRGRVVSSLYMCMCM